MFLKSCEELHPGVNVKNIIILMIERLASHTQKNQETESLQLFDIFSDQVASILQVSELEIGIPFIYTPFQLLKYFLFFIISQFVFTSL